MKKKLIWFDSTHSLKPANHNLSCMTFHRNFDASQHKDNDPNKWYYPETENLAYARYAKTAMYLCTNICLKFKVWQPEIHHYATEVIYIRIFMSELRSTSVNQAKLQRSTLFNNYNHL